jgi:hypothetical protein
MHWVTFFWWWWYRVWTWSLALARQALYCWSHSSLPSPSPFLLQLFFRWGVTFLPRASLRLILCLLCSWDHRHMPACPAIDWDGVLLTFCLGWPQIKILLISTYWVTGITDVSDQICDDSFFGSIRVWTQGLMIARQALYHLSPSTSPGKTLSAMFLPRQKTTSTLKLLLWQLKTAQGRSHGPLVTVFGHCAQCNVSEPQSMGQIEFWTCPFRSKRLSPLV